MAKGTKNSKLINFHLGGSYLQLLKQLPKMDGISRWVWAHINIATYDQQYLAFLSGSQPSTADDAFMEMVEYGPFDLRVWSGDGLEMFLKYVGALMLGKDGS